MNREGIEARIAEHFRNQPIIANKDKLFKLLSLE
jgi:hypothetical protein